MWQHHAWRRHPREVCVWMVGVAVTDEVRIRWIRMRRARRSKAGLRRCRDSSGLLGGWGLGDGGNSGTGGA